MPNIAVLLKQEIARLAKKESRAATEPLRKQISTLRHDVAELKRQRVELQRMVASLTRGKGQVREKAGASDAGAPQQGRITPAGIKTLRARLGLSAEALGTLVGATGQSVYGWEKGVKPRAAQVGKLIELRGKGKKEVRQLLGEGGR